jgi:hypothetical protein
MVQTLGQVDGDGLATPAKRSGPTGTRRKPRAAQRRKTTSTTLRSSNLRPSFPDNQLAYLAGNPDLPVMQAGRRTSGVLRRW